MRLSNPLRSAVSHLAPVVSLYYTFLLLSSAGLGWWMFPITQPSDHRHPPLRLISLFAGLIMRLSLQRFQNYRIVHRRSVTIINHAKTPALVAAPRGRAAQVKMTTTRQLSGY